MSVVRVIGVDPGPIPGVVVLDVGQRGDQAPVLLGSEVIQCTHGVAPRIVEALITGWPSVVAVERFVVGRVSRASGSGHNSPGAVTRDLIGTLQEVVRHAAAVEEVAERIPGYIVRSAAQVKPWATDARLETVGLLERTKGMRHARDAARHALYAAVRDAGLPDPLSRRSAS